MALLMRRLFVDAQAKLRRMVEEHSTSLTSRIDSDYPSTIPAPLPSPACLAQQELKQNESSGTSPGNIVVATANAAASVNPATTSTVSPATAAAAVTLIAAKSSSSPPPPPPKSNHDNCVKAPTSETNFKDASDFGLKGELRDSFKNSRPSSIESRRSKSLCNTSSVDSSEDNNLSKKDVKKTKSYPVSKVDIISDSKYNDQIAMTIQESASPIKDSRSSPENQKSESPKPGCSSQPDMDSSSPRSPRSSDGTRDDLSALLPSPSNYPNKTSSSLRRLRQENEKLQAEVTRLRRLVVSGATTVLSEKKTPTEGADAKTHALEMELQLAKEALTTLKADKRRLKAEKFDLLNQMKQLYSTLEDKEKELRDFIRSYGQRVRDNETSLQQLSTEREERERERWSLLRHARDEAERSLSLAAQLNAKELQLQQAQEQLQEARRQLASSGCLSDQESLASLPRHSINGGALTPGSGGLLSGHHGLGLMPGDRGSCSADSGVRVNSDRESGATSVAGNLSDSTTDGTPTITVEGSSRDMDSISLVSSVPPPHLYQSVSTKDCSPTLSPLNANTFSRSVDVGVLSRSVEQLSSPLDAEPINLSRRTKPTSRPSSGRGGTWGSISRVFARSRHRNKTSSLQETSEHPYEPYRSWSPLTEEGYAEKLRLLREASSIPMERWRAPTVLAWLEVALGMPQYGTRCAENIKSGKIGPLHGQVLLELSDLELECGLGITHPMHRKKLRLAIEEHRHPALVRYPCIAQLGHTWVSSEWLPDLGLSQYSESFASNMVDARMLEHLSKKELEKYLGVTRKFHQASVVHGIHLLRIMKYDRQALAVRRHQCENVDADPLVWTNHRFIRWARSIDLAEYADNLKDSGVHGGLVVLEPSFNGDTMATALGIPASKNIIRRHLTAELEALILPARSTLEHYVRVRAKTRVPGGSLGRSFSRSCGGLTAPPPPTTRNDTQSSDTRRSSIRGSLSRALGLTKNKEREREKHSPTSSSESSSVISRISPPLQFFKNSSRSGGESPIYAQPFAHQQPSSSFFNRRSEDYDTYICKSIDEYEVMSTKSVQSVNKLDHHHRFSDNISGSSKQDKSKFLSNIAGGSLHRNRKHHRRVRSIGDIDVIHVEAM